MKRLRDSRTATQTANVLHVMPPFSPLTDRWPAPLGRAVACIPIGRRPACLRERKALLNRQKVISAPFNGQAQRAPPVG